MASATKAIDGVTSWAALDKAVRDYRHCDKGEAATLFTEALLRVVIDGWPNVEDAQAFLGMDAPLRAWTSKRLGSPAIAKEDAEGIRGLAKSSCPAGRAQLCEYFVDALEFGKPIAMPKPMELAKPIEPPAGK